MSDIECIDFRSHESGALRGFANFRVSDKTLTPMREMEIYGCPVFVKGDQRWMSMPSREYDDNGEKKYISIIRLPQKEQHEAFCKAALLSMDKWREENAQPEPVARTENTHPAPQPFEPEEACPF